LQRDSRDPLAELTARDLCTVLDEELTQLPERFQGAVLLCLLEGQPRDRVARQLGWSLRTLQRRLEAGRRLLKDRLRRRGVELSAALLTVALAHQSSAATAALLTTSTARAALAFANGPLAPVAAIPAHVAALAREVLRAMFVAKLQAGAALVMFILVGTGGALGYKAYCAEKAVPAMAAEDSVTVVRPASPQSSRFKPSNNSLAAVTDNATEPANAKRVTRSARGVVHDESGEPISGAGVFWVGNMIRRHDLNFLPRQRFNYQDGCRLLARTMTDAGGRFSLQATIDPDSLTQIVCWSAGMGMVGRVYTRPEVLISSPAENQDAQPLEFTLRPQVKIEGRLLNPEGGPAKSVQVRLLRIGSSDNFKAPGDWRVLAQPGLDSSQEKPFPEWPQAVTTDEQGRFTMVGLAQDGWAILRAVSDDFAETGLSVESNPSDESVKKGELAPHFSRTLKLGHTLGGMITAKDTGKPLAGVVVAVTAGNGGWYTRTDAHGRYAVGGLEMEKNAGFHVEAQPPVDSGYLGDEINWLSPIAAKHLEQNLALKPSRIIRGTVSDTVTKQPIANVAVSYGVHGSHYFPADPALSDEQGRFSIAVPAGRGMLVADAPRRSYDPPICEYIMPEMPLEDLRYFCQKFHFAGGLPPHAYARLEIPATGEATRVHWALRQGVSIEARAVRPDGTPVPWVYFVCPDAGIAPTERWNGPQRGENGLVRLYGCDPTRAYRVWFYEPDLRLGGQADLKYDPAAPRPKEVRLEPTARIRGSVLNSDGNPATGALVRPLILVQRDASQLQPADVFLRYGFIAHDGLDARFARSNFGGTVAYPKGEFQIDNLLAGTQIYLRTTGDANPLVVVEGQPTPEVWFTYKAITLKPGEVRDIGDLKLEKLPLPKPR
jgi:hypothetical protein